MRYGLETARRLCLGTPILIQFLVPRDTPRLCNLRPRKIRIRLLNGGIIIWMIRTSLLFFISPPILIFYSNKGC